MRLVDRNKQITELDCYTVRGIVCNTVVPSICGCGCAYNCEYLRQTPSVANSAGCIYSVLPFAVLLNRVITGSYESAMLRMAWDMSSWRSATQGGEIQAQSIIIMLMLLFVSQYSTVTVTADNWCSEGGQHIRIPAQWHCPWQPTCMPAVYTS